jgi:AcrR family transcriptional regulator
MGRAQFDQAGFLVAARALIAERGPQSVTVDSVAERLKAPKGSFYYRFASRDALLGEVWLKTVLAYQEGFVAAIEAGDGLRAALHTPAWARRHLDDARLLMLYSRHDFVQGDWPAPLRRGVADQAERFEACLQTFARALSAAPVAPRCAARRLSWRRPRSPRSSRTSSVASGRPSWSTNWS